MVIRPTRCSSFTTNRFRGLVTVAVVFVLHVVPVAAEETDSSSLFSGLPLIVQLLLLALLIALSGVFAGLTLGVMGLDTNSLEIIADAGQEPERSYAKELMPVRKLGHQSLSTLILGNMLANVLISQLIAALTPEGEQVVSFITATLVILIFAEVLPLSVCRGPRALEIAAAGVPILRAFLIILYPIAKPLGMLLDLITPHDAGQVYDRNELRKLMHVHCKAHGDGAVLESTELKMLLGAMDFHECIAGKAMTPISDVFMLEDTAVVNQEMIEMLWREGKSRVPIYQKVRNNVIGILFVKDMISMLAFRSIPDQRGPLHSHVVPSQQLTDVTVGSLLGNTSRDLIRVRYTCTLPQVLAMFQAGTLHMLLVEEDVNQYGASYGRFAGIITLEDVIEELIKGEIRDEYDDEDSSDHEFEVNISTSEGEDQAPPPPHAPMAMTAPPVDDTFRTPLSTLTSLHHTKRIIVPKVPPKLPRVNFNSFYLTGQLLSCDHRWVLADFLQRSVGAFALWKLSHIKLLLDEVGDREVRQVNESDVPREILHRDGSLADSMLFNESSASFTPPLVSPTTAHQTGFNARGATGHMTVTRQTRSDLLLYEYGRASTAMTIVLHGGVRMLVGDDLFNHEARSFTILGEAALNTVPTQGAGGGASHKPFIPDFTAIVSRPSRLLTIHTRDYDRVDGYFQNKVCSKSFAQRMEQEEVRPNRWNESLPT